MKKKGEKGEGEKVWLDAYDSYRGVHFGMVF